jgi:hypothetical protein
MPNDNTSVKPFVKVGEQLGYTGSLKDKGLWPPRLHDRKDNPGHDDKPVTTPFLVIPSGPTDNGARPKPDSLVFHSASVWIEDVHAPGIIVAVPVAGNEYLVKCRIINLGATGSYGGLADFYVNTPATFNANAGTNNPLPALGHTGFSVLQGQMVTIACPHTWKPVSQADLQNSIVVHAYDLFADIITSRYDARNDRHVGRHDFTSDFYVRDWTDSAVLHDVGTEPSVNAVFYHTSDIWNRRTNNPGAFVNDQPQNENPQAGIGAAGDNFVFARISRNNDSTRETVFAHFMFAEFGTGSPYVNCSSAPDPSVVFNPGETTKVISFQWNLHPTSSTHLCLAVQIYTDADPYLAPGLLGYTPGWPTTDMMVINDNNKAQRNMSVWDGTLDAAFIQYAMVFNAATFVRNINLNISCKKLTSSKLLNARISTVGSQDSQPLSINNQVILNTMLPGERRWVAISGDGFKAKKGEILSLFFNETEKDKIVNGFSLNFRLATTASFYTTTMNAQTAIFYRMAEGMKIKSAREGLQLCMKLTEINNVKQYLKSLPDLLKLLQLSLNEFSDVNSGIKDVFGIEEIFRILNTSLPDMKVTKVLGVHNQLLQKIDAWQTMALKNRGDEAVILFTVRLQKDVYSNKKLLASQRFGHLLKISDKFIRTYSGNAQDYILLVRESLEEFKMTIDLLGTNSGIILSRFQLLAESLKQKDAAQVQKAHLDFLNSVLLVFTR